jgi:hypothetical protein
MEAYLKRISYDDPNDYSGRTPLGKLEHIELDYKVTLILR